MKNNAKVSKKSCRKTRIPTCERTDKLEKRLKLLPFRTIQGNVSQKNKTF